MSKIIVVVDCQKDFVDGSLGTPEAQAMIPRLVEKIKNEPEDTNYIFTMDTHFSNYMNTDEGKNLPVPHCIKDTEGWEIDARLTELFGDVPLTVEKYTFGSVELMQILNEYWDAVDEIEFVGLCTDICVVSNALMAKANFYSGVTISCDANCCAGVTPATHKMALEIMKACQIVVKE